MQLLVLHNDMSTEMNSLLMNIYILIGNHENTARNCIKLTAADVHRYVCLMVFNATFNNISVTSTSISWRSVLLVEETEGPG